MPPAEYTKHMLEAKFCPICGGFSQWTPRLAEALYHECVPYPYPYPYPDPYPYSYPTPVPRTVPLALPLPLTRCVPIIMSQHMLPPFAHLLDWSQFSARLAPRDLPSLKTFVRGLDHP